MNNIGLSEVIQMVIILLIGVTFMYIKNQKRTKEIIQGQAYRNFFKSVMASIGLSFNIRTEIVHIVWINGIIFMSYILAVISAIVFIPSIIATTNVWLPIALFILGISLILHIYIKWFNQYMFKTE